MTSVSSAATVLAITLVAIFGSSAAAQPDPVDETYQYDPFGRLTRVIYADGSGELFFYDAAGNRTKVEELTEEPPVFSIQDVAATEGGSLQFTISKNSAKSETYSVDFASSDDTAEAGTDYTAVSGTKTFTDSDMQHTVSVTTSQDTCVESDETFEVTLSNPTGYATVSFANGVAVGSINNDDTNGAPTVVDDTASTLTLEPVDIAVLANDSDPESDPLTVSYVQSLGYPYGSATIIDSSTKVRFTPFNVTGVINFAYWATDGYCNDRAGTISVTVN